MLIVVFILADVIFFSIVFIYMDNVFVEVTDKHDISHVMPWLLCLFEAGGPAEECLDLGQKVLVNMSTVNAILILLGLAGTQCFILLVRRSMFVGWWEMFRSKFSHKREFVSLDAKRYSGEQPRTYELLRVGSKDPMVPVPVHKPETGHMVSPTETQISAFSGTTSEYYTKEYSRPTSRRSQMSAHEYTNYTSPKMSFSGPRTPSQVLTESRTSRNMRDWDPRSTFARGGLGLHPPTEEEDIVEIHHGYGNKR